MFHAKNPAEKKLMWLMSLTSSAAFVVLFWNQWTAPEMVFPKQAFFQLWLPSFPAFLFFIFVIFVCIFGNFSILKWLIYYVPILLIYGSLSFLGIEYTIRSHSLFFFKANLYGFLQILLTLLIIIAWRYNTRALKPHH